LVRFVALVPALALARLARLARVVRFVPLVPALALARLARPARVVRFVPLVPALALAGLAVASAPTAGAAPGSAPVGVSAGPGGQGVLVARADGRVHATAPAVHHGDLAGVRLNAPVVGVAVTPTGGGYWLLAADGGVFAFGDAAFWGSTGGLRLNAPVVAMAATPTGGGYWLLAADGGVFAFGDAGFFGSMGGVRLNRPVTGMTPSPSGNGYRLVAADGGVFSFGDAPFHGSTGANPSPSPVVAMAPSPGNAGYWLVRADGSVVAFGSAAHHGHHPGRQAVDIASHPGRDGYVVLYADGSTSRHGALGGPATPAPTPPSAPTGVDPAAWLVNEPFRGQAGYPAFRTFCTFSHLAYADPIVSPGNPRFMHLHMFFGNTGADHNSTFHSLRTSGDGTCDGGPLNRTAYWMPAVFDGGQVVVPSLFEVYYKAENAPRDGAGRPIVRPYPDGLRVIGGSLLDGSTTNAGRTWGWTCDHNRWFSGSTATIPQCPAGGRLTVWARMPYCWDGRNLDSADHRSHLVYGVHHTWGPCPPSHPIHLPEATQFAHFDNVAPGHQHWYLSSDRMGVSRPNGSTFHADWFGAWEPAIQQRWVTACLQGVRSVHHGNLCDGQSLRRMQHYPGPHRLGGWTPMPHH
jgi:hypothetical protein